MKPSNDFVQIRVTGDEFAVYRRKPSKVVARKARYAQRVRLHSGEYVNARVGDWILEQDGRRWVCEADVFHSLYESDVLPSFSKSEMWLHVSTFVKLVQLFIVMARSDFGDARHIHTAIGTSKVCVIVPTSDAAVIAREELVGMDLWIHDFEDTLIDGRYTWRVGWSEVAQAVVYHVYKKAPLPTSLLDAA